MPQYPDRYSRMRSAWADLMRKNMTKLPFAQFEKRMLERDLKIKKKEYMERRMVLTERNAPTFLKALREIA